MPIYAYRCPQCSTETEVFVRQPRGQPLAHCDRCGSALERTVSQFAFKRDLASELANLDPSYRQRIDAAIAKTPEADPMRHLSRMTPLDAATDPGDPIDF